MNTATDTNMVLHPAGELLTISPHVTCAEMDDTLVVLNVQSGHYYGLNEVASVIFDLLEEHPAPFQELTARLLERYDVDEERLVADLEGVIEKMKQYGIIAVTVAQDNLV